MVETGRQFAKRRLSEFLLQLPLQTRRKVEEKKSSKKEAEGKKKLVATIPRDLGYIKIYTRGVCT